MDEISGREKRMIKIKGNIALHGEFLIEEHSVLLGGTQKSTHYVGATGRIHLFGL